MLPASCIQLQGTTPHVHEQEAIEFVKQALPDSCNFPVWALCDLVDVSGRRYELDLLVLGYHGLYHVEIKSHPGRVSGDVVDWQFTFPDGHTIIRDNPLKLAEHKSRVLGGLLDRQRVANRPFVETLIFLSDQDIKIDLQDAARARVVNREQLVRAFQYGEYPGSSTARRRPPLDKPTIRAVLEAMRKIGLRKSESALRVGSYRLGDFLDDGPGYQDHEAKHERLDKLQRVRTYLVPQSPSTERRDQLRRAAEREARILTAIGDHPNILRLNEYEPEGPTGGPCLLFERFNESERLDSFVRQQKGALSLDDRLQILEQVADALSYCHRKQVLHRGLCPSAVLVRRKLVGQGLETKLFNFQLAQSEGSQGTVHLSQLGGDSSIVYRAPEVIEDPTKAEAASDVFSLGALAYFLLTGRHPGTTLPERYKLFQAAGGYLSPAALAAIDDSFAPGKKPGTGNGEADLAFDESGLPEAQDLEGALKFATHQNPLERADNPIEWVQLLIGELTAPPVAAPAAPDLDALEARVDQVVAGYKVEKILGTGSTARVLRVSKDGRKYALKVSRGPEFDERLRGEGETLKKLRGDRIVAFHSTFEIAGRTALLLDDAGETLAEILNQEGAQSLDYAKRWGEDLLYALRELERRHVLHRDIKPANLAVPTGEAKRTRNLFLFDFSLSEVDPKHPDVGTPAYRDPFVLEKRGWDEAADRFSAAVTLYEILTGTRPRWGAGTVPATASTDTMTIEAERFDPSVRDRLLGFFSKAFARDTADRHDSAETMRDEWVACFLAPKSAEPEAAPTNIDFSALRGDVAIRAVDGLSPRAKNALDRAGVITVQDSLGLPANQLSALRGVGRETQKEIFRFVQGLRAAKVKDAEEAPFFGSFAGEDVFTRELHGLSAAAIVELEAAGLTRAQDAARAPKLRLERVLHRVPDGVSELERALKAARRIDTSGDPRSVEDWVHHSFPRQGKAWEYVRELFAIDQAPGGGYAKDSSELAKRHKVAQPNISVALAKAREKWRDELLLARIADRVQADLRSLGGVARVEQVAELLLNELPNDESEAAGRYARALVRAVAESHAELKLGRVTDRLWLAESSEHLTLAKALGEAADELCQQEPLPSFEQAKGLLLPRVEGTVLSGVPAERLVAVGASASSRAALSARLELYPRGMTAERALRLSATALSSPRLSPQQIRRVVALRYPEAQPLPESETELAELVKDHGLNLTDGWFERAALFSQSSDGTQMAAGARARTERRPTTDPDEQVRREFEERVRTAARNRSFRVLEVSAALAERAGSELARMLGVPAVSLEHEVLAALDEVVGEHEGLDSTVIYDTDREGPNGSENWAVLTDFMEQSAGRVMKGLAQQKGTLVLTQPGILARYQLSNALHTLLQATQHDDGPGVFLVVPSLSEASPTPVIHAPTRPLPIPLSSPGQRLPIPEIWIPSE
ncbi:MAG TPA: protein kinase [Polyangiaceae bacterium]